MVELYLKDMLHLDVMTVTGKTLGENLEDLQRDNFFARNLGYLHNYGLERDQVIFPVEKATGRDPQALASAPRTPEQKACQPDTGWTPFLPPRCGYSLPGPVFHICGGHTPG